MATALGFPEIHQAHAFGNDRCLVKATRIPVARATANNRLIRVTISLPDLI